MTTTRYIYYLLLNRHMPLDCTYFSYMYFQPPHACASPVPAAETVCDQEEITPPTCRTQNQEPANVQDSRYTDSGSCLLQSTEAVQGSSSDDSGAQQLHCSETVQGSSSDDSGSHLLLSSEAITDLKEDGSLEPEGEEQEKLVKDEGN